MLELTKSYFSFLSFIFCLAITTPVIAMPEVVKLSIASFSDLQKVVEPHLNNYETDGLSKTAVFIDFDDTIAHQIITKDGMDYKVLSSPERGRGLHKAYIEKKYTAQYQIPSHFSLLQLISWHLNSVEPEYVEMDKAGLLTALRWIKGQQWSTIGHGKHAQKIMPSAYLAVASGLKETAKKREMLNKFGIKNYLYTGSQKARFMNRIVELFKEKKSTEIRNILFIDNNLSEVIAKVETAAKTGVFKTDVKLILVHFTKASEQLKQQSTDQQIAKEFIALKALEEARQANSNDEEGDEGFVD